MEECANILCCLCLMECDSDCCDQTCVMCDVCGTHESHCPVGEGVAGVITLPPVQTGKMSTPLLSYQKRKDLCFEPPVVKGEPRSLNDLPDGILLKMLSHFGPEDLCFITAKVCERWNALSKNVMIWKELSYSCDPTSDISRVVQVLTVAPALHSLVISKRVDAVRIVGTLIDSHVDIGKLILKDCYLGDDSTGLLTNIVALYPDLEALSLERCYPITSAGYSLIPRLKKLSELNLSNRQELLGETVRHIADSCQNLKKLNLDSVYPIVDDADVIHIIQKLGNQLTTLVLHGGALTDVAYSYLNKCARLQELKVSGCYKMTDRGLLDGIGSLRELTSLHLSTGPCLTARALSTFLHQPSTTSIVSLNLSYCFNLDDEGLKRIANSCVRLKELAVCWCSSVTDGGISMVICNCVQLCVLNLKGLTNITGDGWLALVPAHLPHLRLLCLEACDRVCDKYTEELVAAAPKLLVINCRGHVLGPLSNKQLEAAYKGSKSEK